MIIGYIYYFNNIGIIQIKYLIKIGFYTEIKKYLL